MQAACLRCLSRREYGRAELRQKLLALGYPELLVDQAIAETARLGLQSDVRYAESLTRSRVGKGYGQERIRQELRQRGVGREDQPDLAEWDWDALIERAYSKKYGDTLPGSLAEQAARERFLLRRGFGHDSIRRLFRRLKSGDED